MKYLFDNQQLSILHSITTYKSLKLIKYISDTWKHFFFQHTDANNILLISSVKGKKKQTCLKFTINVKKQSYSVQATIYSEIYLSNLIFFHPHLTAKGVFLLQTTIVDL